MTSAAIVRETHVPERTAIHATLPDADFFDAYEVPDGHPSRTALQTWLDVVARTPRWTQRLMALRNRLVQLVGLKGLGQLHDLHTPASGAPAHHAGSYRVGDRVGIFRIRHLSDTEVVLGQDDKHLDVQVSLTKHAAAVGPATVVVTTVVHIHNLLGQAYMGLVTPFHRRIVPTMLRRLNTPEHHGQR